MAEARAGVAAVARRRRRLGRPDPRDHRRDERGDPPARLAIRRTSRDDGPRARRRDRAADRAPRPDGGRGRLRRGRRRRRRRADHRRVRCRDHRGHPARVDLARAVDDRRGAAGRQDRRDRPCPRCAAAGRRRTGRWRHPGPARHARRGPLCRAGPEMAARSGGDGRARRGPGADRRARPGARRLVQLRADRWPRRRRVVVRCPTVRGDRLPSAVRRGHGPLDRLAVDVRRPRLRPPARGRIGRRGGRPSRGRSRVSVC